MSWRDIFRHRMWRLPAVLIAVTLCPSVSACTGALLEDVAHNYDKYRYEEADHIIAAIALIRKAYHVPISYEGVPERSRIIHGNKYQSRISFSLRRDDTLRVSLNRLVSMYPGEFQWKVIKGIVCVFPNDRGTGLPRNNLDVRVSINLSDVSVWEACCALAREINAVTTTGYPVRIYPGGLATMRRPLPELISDRRVTISLVNVTAREALCEVLQQAPQTITFAYVCSIVDSIYIDTFEDGVFTDAGRLSAEEASWWSAGNINRLQNVWPHSARQALFRLPDSGRTAFVYGGAEWADLVSEKMLKRIYVWEAGSGDPRCVYESSVSIHEIRANGHGLIAFAENHGSGSFITVIEASGTIFKRIACKQPVKSVFWNPDGSKFAYVTGETAEDNFATYIHCLHSGKSERIFDGGEMVRWMHFDGHLYIYDSTQVPIVNRYDPHSQKLHPTHHRHIHLNSNALYYFIPESGSLTPQLYFRTSDRSVVGESPLSQTYSLVFESSRSLRWIHTVSVAFTTRVDTKLPTIQQPFYLFDVNRGVVRRSKGFILEPHAQESIITLMPGGELELELIEDMPVVKAEDLDS